MSEALSAGHRDYGRLLQPGAREISPYAATSVPSRGRVFDEPACPTRSSVQRDRDRIIHSSAFRRLAHKTQMFVYHEGDHYRTRLTHSLEVAQIARTIARQLCLDEDLAEAIALAHDLGHPPFGHAGEDALDAALSDCGGFDHNVQSLRLVSVLEHKYGHFDGLNLTWETLEGLVKHNGPPALGARDGDAAMVNALRCWPDAFDLQLSMFPSAEAQVAALADDIAWHTHDIDDGLSAGMLTVPDLEAVCLIQPIIGALDLRPTRDPDRDIYEITRQLITRMIADVVSESRNRLSAAAPVKPDDVRSAGRALVAFSVDMQRDLDALRSFLFANLYRHPRINEIMSQARGVVTDLVGFFQETPSAMPDTWRERTDGRSRRERLRVVGDFVAGMTDRYALSEHRRLFDATPQLR
ncbi:MAG: deoxyguanosinetriphosphate triphosphohydrolase [Pseudomonadota bacterium]